MLPCAPDRTKAAAPGSIPSSVPQWWPGADPKWGGDKSAWISENLLVCRRGWVHPGVGGQVTVCPGATAAQASGTTVHVCLSTRSLMGPGSGTKARVGWGPQWDPSMGPALLGAPGLPVQLPCPPETKSGQAPKPQGHWLAPAPLTPSRGLKLQAHRSDPQSVVSLKTASQTHVGTPGNAPGRPGLLAAKHLRAPSPR